jgi:hypothetical protein
VTRAANCTIREILDAINTVGPFPALVAKRLGIKADSLHHRLRRNATLAKAYADKKAYLVDIAEKNIMEAVEAGNLKQSQFILRTLGKDRGYTMRDEVVGQDGGPISLATSIVNNRLEGLSENDILAHLAKLAKAAADIAGE